MLGFAYFARSFLNLILLRIISRVIPILMSGYIIKNTGLHSFGKLEFAKVLNYFFKLIISYGFLYTIPIYFYKSGKNFKKVELPQLFGAILLIKFILTILCFFLLFIILHLFPFLINDFFVIFFFFLVAVSSGFLPICIYQGLEKLHVITILNSATKFFFYFSIPFYVKSEDDIIYYPIVYSIVELIRVAIAYFILFYFYKVKISLPSISLVKEHIYKGFSAFCFSFYIFFCNNFSILFLRIYLGSVYVGVYKLGSNVLYLCQQILEPFLQCFYPIMKDKFSINVSYGFRFSLKVLFFYTLSFLLCSLLCFIYSFDIVKFFCKNDFIEGNTDLFISAVSILKINIMIFLMSMVSSFIGMQVFSSLGRRYLYSFVLFFGSIISMTLHFNFVLRYGVLGASFSVLVGELFIFLIMSYFYTFVKIK